MNFESERQKLVDNLVRYGYLSDERVIDAFRKVPRELFIPEAERYYAYIDQPLFIGAGQTISAPSMVAIMTDVLDLRQDSKVLEVGSGSGYQAAIIAHIVQSGTLYTTERIPELAEFAQANLKNAGCTNVEVIVADGTLGLEEFAPYNRIIVTAGAPKIPVKLKEQLCIGGKLAIPVGSIGFQDLKLVTKIDDNKFDIKSRGGCVFVPLVGADGW